MSYDILFDVTEAQVCHHEFMVSMPCAALLELQAELGHESDFLLNQVLRRGVWVNYTYFEKLIKFQGKYGCFYHLFFFGGARGQFSLSLHDLAGKF